MGKFVSLSKGVLERWSGVGKTLIDENLASGFNIEDFNPKTQRKPVLIYGHDNPSHLALINNVARGKRYPRVSLYRWNPTWTKGENTDYLYGDTLARERAYYLETPSKNIDRTDKYARAKAFRNLTSCRNRDS